MSESSFSPGDIAIAKFARYPAQVTIEERLPDGSWRVRTRTGATKVVRRLESPDGLHVETADNTPATEEATPATTVSDTVVAEEQPTEPLAPTVPSEKAVPPTKLSLVNAAAAVLERSDEPLPVKAMIEQAKAAGLWSPGGGKTPEQTLYSSIIREIREKGERSRFSRGEVKGTFAFVR
jgi:hypothetical protein